MNDRMWVIKSKSSGVVQIVRGVWTTRESAEKSIMEHERAYYGVDYMVVNPTGNGC